MILTNCAACAAPLAHNAPRCVRCKLRYCDATCQHDHWRRGHKQMCKKIHRGGNAEQYNADKKYKEAVAVAVEACADDTKGQTCYICLEAVHARTGEGLVRGCACGDRDGVASGMTGVAHVSCLAEQAKILMDEAEETNLGGKAMNERFQRWYKCSLCEQRYHGVVSCALGWACWKTYLGRPENDPIRRGAMYRLGDGLYHGSSCNSKEEALSVFEAHVDTIQRIFPHDADSMLQTKVCIANCYKSLNRIDEGLKLERSNYVEATAIWGASHRDTLLAASNLASSLSNANLHGEAIALLRKARTRATRVYGAESHITLLLCGCLGQNLYLDPDVSCDQLRESIALLESNCGISTRVLGSLHPTTDSLKKDLAGARARMYLREAEAREPRPTPSTRRHH